MLVLHHFSVEKLNVKLLSEKQNKLIARLWELLNQFPQFQVEDDDFSEDLMRIRSKFKLLEAQVNTQFRSLSVDRLPRIQDLTF